MGHWPSEMSIILFCRKETQSVFSEVHSIQLQESIFSYLTYRCIMQANFDLAQTDFIHENLFNRTRGRVFMFHL